MSLHAMKIANITILNITKAILDPSTALCLYAAMMELINRIKCLNFLLYQCHTCSIVMINKNTPWTHHEHTHPTRPTFAALPCPFMVYEEFVYSTFVNQYHVYKHRKFKLFPRVSARIANYSFKLPWHSICKIFCISLHIIQIAGSCTKG